MGQPPQEASGLLLGRESGASKDSPTTLPVAPSLSYESAFADPGESSGNLAPPEGSGASLPSHAPVKRIGDDLRVVWGGPVQPSARRLLPVLAATGVLVALDQGTTEPGFDKRIGDHGWAKSLANATNNLGGWEGMAAMGGLYALGDSRDKDTAKLALAAVADAGLITSVLKFSLGRARPSDDGERTLFRPFSSYSSMPSGHATAAFAMATVLSHRYPKFKWLFYPLATSVAFARVQKDRHFVSDVFVGGAIGVYGAQRVLANEQQILSWKF